MKHLILIVTFLLPLMASQAQVADSISIIAIDNLGNTDTVVFGFAPNATVGVDTALGERDISSEPMADLDMRLIQRTTVTIDSFWLPDCPDGYIKPFEQELELKKDIRDFSGKEDFIIKVHAVNYPVILKEFFQDDNSILNGLTIPFCQYDKNLNITFHGDLTALITNESPDTILTINEESSDRLIGFHPQYIVNVSNRKEEGKFSIFPNPCKDFLAVRVTNNSNKLFTVCDINGRVTEEFHIYEGENYYIDVSKYPKGVYFITNGFLINKFIKH